MIRITTNSGSGTRTVFISPEGIESIRIIKSTSNEIRQCALTTKSGETHVISSDKQDDIKDIIKQFDLRFEGEEPAPVKKQEPVVEEPETVVEEPETVELVATKKVTKKKASKKKAKKNVEAK